MSKNIFITLQGQSFSLTSEELRQHMLACCHAGVEYSGANMGQKAVFADVTRSLGRGVFQASDNTGRDNQNSAEDSIDY